MHRQLRVIIQSKGLPIGAGLGSSAAFSVAASAAAFQLVTKLREQPGDVVLLDQEIIERINVWAYSGEVLMHGNPSGLDNTTSSYGGLVSFVKDPTLGIQFSTVPSPPKMRILLVNTRVPRSTRQLVANVTALYQAHPAVVKPLFDSITAITKTFQKNIEDLRALEQGSESYDTSYGRFIEDTVNVMFCFCFYLLEFFFFKLAAIVEMAFLLSFLCTGIVDGHESSPAKRPRCRSPCPHTSRRHRCDCRMPCQIDRCRWRRLCTGVASCRCLGCEQGGRINCIAEVCW